MNILKQSTAVDILFGPFLDETNGKDAETGLTITQADVRLSKNGGNMAQKNEATALSHDEIGYYVCKLDGTDTGTLGILKVMVHESGALPVWADFLVVTANVYDSLCSTDKLDVSVTQWLGQAVTADSNVPEVHVVGIDDGTITAAKLGADCITSAKIADDAIAAEHIASGAIVADTLAADCITSAKIADNAIAAEHIAAAAIDNATFAADVGSTAYATNIIALAVRKALDEINLDHLLKVTTGVAADGDLENFCVAGTVMGHLLSTSADATLYKASTDSLQAIRDHIGDGTNLTEAGGDGDHLTEAGGDGDHLVEAGGDGDHLTAINLPNQTMDITGDITGNLSGSVGTCAAATVSAIGNNVITAASINADAITAAKVAADVHTESATAVWAATEGTTGNSNAYGAMAVKLFRFFMNDMTITDATGAVALRNEANDADVATQTITDDDTTTTRTDLVWS